MCFYSQLKLSTSVLLTMRISQSVDCVDHNKLWKILKEMGIPDHLTCLLKNPTVRTGHRTTGWFKLGKEYIKAVYCHPVYLTYIQSTLWEIPGWMTHKLESRLWEKYQQPQICRWYHFNGRKSRETEEPLDEGEREEWKSWLEVQHSKNKDHSIWFYHVVTNGRGKKQTQWQISFSWAPKPLWMVTVATKLKGTWNLEEKLWPNWTVY